MAEVTSGGIVSPGDGDEYDYVVDMKALADTAQAAIDGAVSSSGAVIVADAEERDDLFPTPTQGNRVWRNDLGYTETYYATYDETTNPGGKTVAGWARDGWNFSGGTLPLALGGTGASSRSGARSALGFSSGTGNPSGGNDGDIYFKIVG